MKNYKTFLLDLDGTIYNGDTPIREAENFINLLLEKNLEYFFISNNGHEPTINIVKKLNKMGIKATEDNVITCIDATLHYLKKNYKNSKIHLIGNAFLENLLIKHGFILTNEKPNIVLVGFDDKLNFEKLSMGTKYVLEGAKLICTGVDGSIPSNNGIIPYTGAICSPIALASNTIPVYMGKPEKYMYEAILEKTKNNPKDFIMIGDRLDTDIAFGKSNNINTCLLLTGVTNKEMVDKSQIKPTLVCKDLNDLVLLIK